MFGRRLLGILAIALLGGLVAPQGASAAPDVSAVRLGLHPEKTRFVMEIGTNPAYRIFTLPDPYRVVIDLPRVNWAIPQDTVKRQSKGVVNKLRFGLFSPETSRVVLDANAPVRVTSAFVIPPRNGFPHRLVVDLKQTSRQAFLSDVTKRTITSSKPLPDQERRERRAPTKRGGKRTVVIDAGHGGVDPGAIGVTGVHEKVIALDYAQSLRKALEATGRYNVVMTRDRDIFLRLRRRVAIAQESEGDLFISLHANTHPSSSIRGASVYTLSETASDAEAAALAEKENKADVIAGVDLGGQTETVSQILIDLAQREAMNASKYFANLLVGELRGDVKLLRNTHRFAGFAVLKSPNVPSVLFEIGYMSHPQEVNLLQSSAHRRKVNRSVVDAVDRFFKWQEARTNL
jgi:N-acetylmuramoyl-L-alanine amidase